MSETKPTAGRKYWLDDPANVKRLIALISVLCGLLFVADFVYHKHSHFEIEDWFGFYSIFGFVSFFGIVIAGKYLRKLIMRREDYYDE